MTELEEIKLVLAAVLLRDESFGMPKDLRSEAAQRALWWVDDIRGKSEEDDA